MAGSYSTILSARSTMAFVRCKRVAGCDCDCNDDDFDAKINELVDPKLLEEELSSSFEEK